MNNSVIPVLPAPVVRLGIRGLPNLTDSMNNGGVYVLIAETPSARFPILAGGLASAIQDGLACSVIVPTNPEQFIQRIESFGHLNTPELFAAKRLQFFVMQDEFPKKIFRFGADRFTQELEQFGVSPNSYLLFDQADELLSLHDLSLALDQIDLLSKWFAQQRITCLLVFSRTTEAHANTLNALMDNLNGIARLGANKDRLELTFDYWQSSEGSIAGRNYQLNTLESGLYEATTQAVAPPVAFMREESQPAPRGGQEPEAPDTDHFFYMDPDLGSLARQMPGTWQRVDTLVGMMHATRNIRDATCILSFQRDTSLRQLAEAVHTLRLSLGRQARIVVQEKNASLRYQNEALLLRLGLNLVVNRDVPSSRLPLLLEALSGQLFNRDVDINFEAALASVLPTRLRGYLLPLRFAREVSAILEQAVTLNIPCAMVIGKPGMGRTMTDAVTHVGLSRPGDLISADQEECYLFLNACPQSVMLVTLERILGMPVDQAFSNIRFAISREEIQPELAALSRAAEHGELPDYSAMSTTWAEESATDRAAAPLLPDTPAPALLAPESTAAPAPEPQQPPVIAAQAPQASPAPAPAPVAVMAAVAVVAQTPVAPPVQVAPKQDRPHDVKRAPLAQPSQRVDPQKDAPLFSYGNTPTPSFGRKEAPRATRSAPPAAPAGAADPALAKLTD